MHWNAQVTSLTLRGYESNPNGYDLKVPYEAVIQVEILGDGTCYMHAALREDGKRLTAADFADIGSMLRDGYGVHTVLMHRGEKLVPLSVERFTRGRA